LAELQGILSTLLLARKRTSHVKIIFLERNNFEPEFSEEGEFRVDRESLFLNVNAPPGMIIRVADFRAALILQ
jgi:hypothetical protein